SPGTGPGAVVSSCECVPGAAAAPVAPSGTTQVKYEAPACGCAVAPASATYDAYPAESHGEKRRGLFGWFRGLFRKDHHEDAGYVVASPAPAAGSCSSCGVAQSPGQANAPRATTMPPPLAMPSAPHGAALAPAAPPALALPPGAPVAPPAV